MLCYTTKKRKTFLRRGLNDSKNVEPSVNTQLDRYESEGIVGLQTRKGRGRKPILNVETDSVVVKAAIKVERQRLTQT